MKIVFIIPNMTGGGTERVISLLANEYRSRGMEVAIMMFAGDECAYRLGGGGGMEWSSSVFPNSRMADR